MTKLEFFGLTWGHIAWIFVAQHCWSLGHVLLKLATAHFPSGGFQEATTFSQGRSGLTGVTADSLYIKYLFQVKQLGQRKADALVMQLFCIWGMCFSCWILPCLMDLTKLPQPAFQVPGSLLQLWKPSSWWVTQRTKNRGNKLGTNPRWSSCGPKHLRGFQELWHHPWMQVVSQLSGSNIWCFFCSRLMDEPKFVLKEERYLCLHGFSLQSSTLTWTLNRAAPVEILLLYCQKIAAWKEKRTTSFVSSN